MFGDACFWQISDIKMLQDTQMPLSGGSEVQEECDDVVVVETRSAASALEHAITMAASVQRKRRRTGKLRNTNKGASSAPEYKVRDIIEKKGRSFHVLWADGSKTWEPYRNVAHLLKESYSFSFKKK